VIAKSPSNDDETRTLLKNSLTDFPTLLRKEKLPDLSNGAPKEKRGAKGRNATWGLIGKVIYSVFSSFHVLPGRDLKLKKEETLERDSEGAVGSKGGWTVEPMGQALER